MTASQASTQEKIDSFLRIFYGLKLAFFSWSFQLYASGYEAGLGKKFWLNKILKEVFQTNESFIITSLIEFTILIALMLIPRKKKLRLFECFYSLIYVALLFKAKNLGHSIFGFLICSFPLAFIDTKNLGQIIRIALGLHLSTYFCSGLWKVFAGFKSYFRGEFTNFFLTQSLPLSVARKGVVLGHRNPFIDLFISLPTFLHVTIWISTILIQLSFLYFILKRKYPASLGVFIVVFHLLTILLLDINFIEAQVLTMLLFFLGVPLIKETEQIN